MSYYFTADGQNVQGPIPLAHIAAMVRQSRLPPNVHVCAPGGQWQPISSLAPVEADPNDGAAAEASASPRQTAPEAAASSSEPLASRSAVTDRPTSEAPRSVARSEASAPRPSPIATTTEPTSTTALAQAQTAALQGPADFSDLLVASKRPVQAKQLVSQGTTFHQIVAFFLFLGAAIVLTLSTWGVGPLVILIAGWFMARRIRVQILGNGVRVGADQFPEIHRCTQDFARRLGMKKVPEVYIVEGSALNAMALKVGKGSYVVLVDDIVHGALMAGETKALSFIIGHELAHHALGHTGSLGLYMSSLWKPLSRCNEMTCDAVAAALVEDREVCARGLGMILVGPQLIRNLSWKALDRQASELLSNRLWKPSERSMTHPHLLRRYAALRQG